MQYGLVSAMTRRALSMIGVWLVFAAGVAHADETALGLTLEAAPGMLVRARVAAVEPGSPAAIAGLEPGDQIISGKRGAAVWPIADQAAWMRYVRGQPDGQPLQISYIKASGGSIAQATLTAQGHKAYLGASFKPHFSGVGLEVVSVDPNGPAAAAGILPGDRVLSYVSPKGVVWRTLSLTSLDTLLNTSQPGAQYLLSVSRETRVKGRLVTLGTASAATGPTPVAPSPAGASPTDVAVASPAAPEGLAAQMPSGTPVHAFCGGFDPGFRVFYRSSAVETLHTEDLLQQRWAARLKTRHNLAQPSGLFCMISADAPLVNGRRQAMGDKLKAEGMLLVEDDL